jgi:superfamily II DNA/RNA helicase
MFKEGFMNVMIANNMVSRGFDMPSLKLVINFDVP